ncbi:MAG TPA: glycosyltransferase family 4 protein [Candidatus Dormibacteraeota bacterium]|nr:glycosyltransferase family 4 protein [Candidatus Dormibacteraeota bacterium]
MTSRNRLRAAFISYAFGEYSVRLVNALTEHVDVMLIIPDRVIAPHRAKLHSGVRLVSFQNPRLRQPIQQIRSIRRLIHQIHEFSPDVIHYQGTHLWFDLALPLLCRYPLVFTVHDVKPHPGDRLTQKTPQWIENFARCRADELIVHTKYTRNLLDREIPGASAKTSVIPHLQIGGGPSPANSEEDGNLILFFGRIWEYKGLEYLIRAEPLITARVPKARILIAGKGEDFGRYRQMMVHPDRFLVHNGFIPENLAADYFQRASLVVLPYIEASQSGVVPMAYSAGKPVVATTVGGLPEMVENGHTGYLVAPRDVVQLAEAVTKLLLDPPLCRRMGANGNRKIKEECSPKVVAQETFAVYVRAVERTAHAQKAALVTNSSAVTSRSGDAD